MVTIPTSIAWPVALIIFIAIVLVVIVLTYLNTRLGFKHLHLVDPKEKYFILSDVVQNQGKKLDKELEVIEKTYKRFTKMRIFCFTLVLILAAVLCARPGDVKPVSEQLNTRDIVLCLDVSGSTLPYDKEILTAYKQIVNTLSGERMALSIFNSTSRSVFPLTNDYSLIARSLNNAISAMSSFAQTSIQTGASSGTDAQSTSSNMQDILYFLAGTSSKTEDSSLIGDGLMNCAIAFGNTSEGRSRSIVFATDNILSGNPIYSLDESAKYVQDQGIKLYTIYSGVTALQGQENEIQLRNATQDNNGYYFFTAKGANSVQSIINNIVATEQKELNPDSKSIVEDRPELIIYSLLLIFSAYLVICWRLKQ